MRLSKTPICCACPPPAGYPRPCGVLLCTPHSSGFVRAWLKLPTLRTGPRFRKLPSRERDFAKLNLHMDIFHQPLRSRFFDSLNIRLLWAGKYVTVKFLTGMRKENHG
jgi:hypothetical protein